MQVEFFFHVTDVGGQRGDLVEVRLNAAVACAMLTLALLPQSSFFVRSKVAHDLSRKSSSE